MANIYLTPEKPEYNGGVWHVEGMNNEKIVSSGIYYYESENISFRSFVLFIVWFYLFDYHYITESRLHFRVNIHEPPYEQSDDNGIRKVTKKLTISASIFLKKYIYINNSIGLWT